MPSTIVKLCSSDARAWAHNQPLWLHQNGETARPVTREEQHAISRTLERTRDRQSSFRVDLPLHAVVAGRHGTGVRSMPSQGRPLPSKTAPGAPEIMKAAFEVSYVGKSRTVTVWNGDLRYAQGRDVLRARLLADHGECVLHGLNGKCMAVLRDPFVADRAPREGRRVQRSVNPADQARVAASPVAAVRHSGQSLSGKEPVRSPELCPNDCRGRRGGGEWALAKGARPPTENEHHPICKFAAAWAETLPALSSGEILYDLELGTVARPAMPNEIEEADAVEKRTGVRQVTVGGRLFAVLPREEAQQAAREARGEGTEEPSPIEVSATFPDTGVEPALAELTVSEGVSTPEDRASWPSLDGATADTYKQRAEVTAATYLARQPMSAPTSSASASSFTEDPHP